MARLRLGVLISGRGSNLKALIAACRRRQYPAEVCLVVSNNAGAAGLTIAAQARIPVTTISHHDRPREAFEDGINAALAAANVELVCLAGFMRVLTQGFVQRWHDRLINIHPSLLPAFPGLDVHRRVLESGARFSGCTVHFVRPETDAGPIIAQAAVPVNPGDDADRLAARVLTAEHRIYPMAVRWIAEGRVTVEGRRASVRGAEVRAGFLLNPGSAA